MRPPFSTVLRRFAFFAMAALLAVPAVAESTHYTYQGRLEQNGVATNGVFDLRFQVFASAGGDILLTTTYSDDMEIAEGLFTARIAIAPIYSVGPRWVEVAVRPGSVPSSDRSEASYTTLSPRQELTPTPYALHAEQASSLRLPVDQSLNLLGVCFRIKNDSNSAIWGETSAGFGVTAKAASGIALYAHSEPSGWAGVFQGPVSINDRIAINYGNSTSIELACNGIAAKPGGGSWTVLSDQRMKQNIRPLRGALERVLQLEGFTFEYTPEAIERGLALEGPQIGLVAQQVERVFPDWVDQDADGTKLVTEHGTTALFVEALRELRAEKDAENQALREEIAALRAELRALAEVESTR